MGKSIFLFVRPAKRVRVESLESKDVDIYSADGPPYAFNPVWVKSARACTATDC
jgi:hypothetical protein